MPNWKYDSGYLPIAGALPFDRSQVEQAITNQAHTTLKGPSDHHIKLWLHGDTNSDRLLVIAESDNSRLNVIDVLPVKQHWGVEDPIEALTAVVERCGVETGYGEYWTALFVDREFEKRTHSVGFRSSTGELLQDQDVVLRERSFDLDTGALLILLAYGYKLADLSELFP